MYEIENVLRPYAWGSTTAIAGLLGRQASGGPEAELWVGAHPDSPSVATPADGGPLALDELISSDPEHHLGSASVAEFGPRLHARHPVSRGFIALEARVRTVVGRGGPTADRH